MSDLMESANEIGVVIRGVSPRRCSKCHARIEPFERFLYFPIHKVLACATCAGANTAREATA